MGKNDSQFGSQPLVGTRGTLGGHLHFIWDTLESPEVQSNYICHSLVPLSFTHILLVAHLVSKVSSECFITDLSGLRGELLQNTGSMLFSKGAYPFCHLYVSQ